VISMRPTAAFESTDVQFAFNCANTDLAPTIVGLNTVLLTASSTPVPDLVALAATLGNDGIVSIARVTGTGVFSVATTNVGTGGTITVSADTGAATLPLTLSVCETNPATGACEAPPAPSVTRVINGQQTPTFGIFVTGTGTVPFDPAGSRIFVRLKDANGVTRGSTSVAVRTE